MHTWIVDRGLRPFLPGRWLSDRQCLAVIGVEGTIELAYDALTMVLAVVGCCGSRAILWLLWPVRSIEVLCVPDA